MHPLDRARSIAAIRRSGISIREIARQLGRSPTLLRHLLRGLEAPASDIKLSREEAITFNELVRRADAARARRSKDLRLEDDRKRSDAAGKAANLICKWLEQTEMNGRSCEEINKDVRRKMAEDELNGSLPPRPDRIPLPVDEIIRRCMPPDKPPERQDNSITLDGWFAGWLCRWVFWAFPDSFIRSVALDIALEQQEKTIDHVPRPCRIIPLLTRPPSRSQTPSDGDFQNAHAEWPYRFVVGARGPLFDIS